MLGDTLVKLLPKRQSLVCELGRHFYRFKPALQYEHIHLLFSKTIDWNLIETMQPEMLRVRYPEVSNIDDFSDFTIPRASSVR